MTKKLLERLSELNAENTKKANEAAFKKVTVEIIPALEAQLKELKNSVIDEVKDKENAAKIQKAFELLKDGA